MIELTPQAQSRFDEYLQRMRRTLRGSRSVEPSEVEANVVEHVELALAGVPAPIGAERLGAVLEQLGPPERWIPDEERPAWRRALERLMHGPEDWRLPYLAFGLFCLSMLLFPIGGVFLLVLAFLLSRAAVDLFAERDEAMGAKRWLILPSIYVLLFLLALGAIFAPAAGAVGFLFENERELGLDMPAGRLEQVRYVAGVIASAFGSWWIVLSALFALTVNRFRQWFLPVTASWKRKHALIFLITGGVVGSIGAWLLFAGR